MADTLNLETLSIKDNNTTPPQQSPPLQSSPSGNGGGKKAAVPSHGLTEDQLKKAATLLKSQVKDINAQVTTDGMNGHQVTVVSNKESDFVIAAIGGVELAEYQLIHAVPKLVKLETNGKTVNKGLEDLKFKKYYLSQKWNGMNIQIFKYKDQHGQTWISAKPRATAFVQNDQKGCIIDNVKQVLSAKPELISQLKDDKSDIQSVVFELCGSKVPHIVKYDFELDLKPVFTIRSNTGEITPVVAEGTDIVTSDSEIPISTLLKDMEAIKVELYSKNKEFRKVNGLRENMFWFNHFAEEGRVLYILNDQGTLLQPKLIYSVKPQDTEKAHWEQFDTELQSKILLIVHELQEKGMPVNKDTLAKEMDLDEYSWNRHSADILDLAILPNPNDISTTPTSNANNKKGNNQKSTTDAKPKKQSKILITCGFPASGKSYFSQKLAESPEGWKRINQDDLGTRKKCEDLFKQYLKTGDNIIVDRCNQDILQRRNWLKMARLAGVSDVHLLWFKIDQQICKDRIVVRENHPTIPKGEEGIQIIDKFQNMFTEPSPLEGFASLTIIQSEADSNELIVKYTSSPSSTTTTTVAVNSTDSSSSQ
ncbi:hypothetical protein DLAC_01278 [Tieghemostelium lacteum]|uniref:Uncharacterized protein n=1 Tax=Tieghemostelium lacteum TaxID=361077 RepID=A0A152A8A9_TIELA|nr:hypothetical protein DLAC_01278 [Tieghemostelium lacteum]|eukprot:KYR02438.1 hypothetical protein DLAC_01278 [Tieghemostelium lacteum]